MADGTAYPDGDCPPRPQTHLLGCIPTLPSHPLPPLSLHFLCPLHAMPMSQQQQYLLQPFFLTSLSSHPCVHLPDDSVSVADHFVCELEDEMGVMTGSCTCTSQQEQEPRPSSTRSAAGEQDVLLDPGKKLLPDFWLGSYKSTLEDAKWEASKGALHCPTK